MAAGRAAAQLPGADLDGALSRALDKVAGAIGEPALAVELAAPSIADDLQAAARDGVVVRLRYWAPSTDTVTDRRIAPRVVFTDQGHWYVLADDLDADGERTFRLDRIEGLDLTDERVAPRDAEPPTDWFEGDTSTVEVELDLATSAAWVVESGTRRSR